jgi:ribose transport system ATP-binding protein
LTRTMFGFLPHVGGTLSVNGKPVRFHAPSEAVKHGIGYVPRERRVEGLVLPLSISVNLTLASLASVFTGFALNHARERSLAREWIQRLRVRARSIDSACLHLSGGNQQKVVLAKWMNAGSKILILDHPTRGLDVGAKAEVYDLMRQLSAEGVAIVLTADTLEETIGLCHTILVMRDGEVTARFAAPPHGKPTQVELIRCMV